MSCFIPKDELMIIKSIDLYTYFKTIKPDELVKHSVGDYITKTHSSLHISNGLWNYFKGGIGGRNAVDYLMKIINESTFNSNSDIDLLTQVYDYLNFRKEYISRKQWLLFIVQE